MSEICNYAACTAVSARTSMTGLFDFQFEALKGKKAEEPAYLANSGFFAK